MREQSRAMAVQESKEQDDTMRRIKRRKVSLSDLFGDLPDDLVVCILLRLSSSSSRPSDFFNAALACKRFHSLALTPLVLAKASEEIFSIRASKWCESAHQFMLRCVEAGNIEASYTLGMIRFYCLKNRGSGASLMARAAMRSHTAALYSLAVIQFNGSGGTKNDKDLRAGVALCARAASLGHIDALRELGHCLQDGYGVVQNKQEGRRLLIVAHARELATRATRSPKVHPANRFLLEWFAARESLARELRVCSQEGCGRPETRCHEFRRCSICGCVNYCSRGCQALDWKVRHKVECDPVERWIDVADDVDVTDVAVVAD